MTEGRSGQVRSECLTCTMKNRFDDPSHHERMIEIQIRGGVLCALAPTHPPPPQCSLTSAVFISQWTCLDNNNIKYNENTFYYYLILGKRCS